MNSGGQFRNRIYTSGMWRHFGGHSGICSLVVYLMETFHSFDFSSKEVSCPEFDGPVMYAVNISSK